MSGQALTGRIDFSEEQGMMLDTAVEFCAKQSPIEAVRALLDDESGFDRSIWEEQVALGWTGIAVPEAYGGSGLGLGEVVTLLEPMGRHLLTTPLFSTTLAAQTLVAGGTEAQKSEYLPRICEGAVAAVAVCEAEGNWDLAAIEAGAVVDGDRLSLTGSKTFVTDAAAAEFLIASVLLEGVPSLVLIDAEAIPEGALARETVIDETRRSYRLDLSGISIPADAALASRPFDALRNTALLLQAAEMCGGIAGVLDVLIEYLNTRKQFGRLIGSYQALKHPTVDVLMGLEQSRSHLYHAASVVGTDEEEVAVRMAKASASDAFAFAGDRAVQFHGAFGFTYECDAQLYLRRAIWCQYQYGDARHQRRHLADLLL